MAKVCKGQGVLTLDAQVEAHDPEPEAEHVDDVSALAIIPSGQSIDPCRALWLAVLRAAILDVRVLSPYDDRDADQEAWKWFYEGGPWFRTVCELAGFDPTDLRSRVLARHGITDPPPMSQNDLVAIDEAPDYRPKARTQKPTLMPDQLWRFGVKPGTKRARALEMFLRGARMREVEAEIGHAEYNLLRGLAVRGYTVTNDNGTIKVLAGPPAANKKPAG